MATRDKNKKGLRNPSETLQLRWVNVDWETSIMNVWDEKRNRYRQVPIFSELRPYLEESWEQAEPGQKYVITRWRYEDDPNLRTQFIKIIKRAGVTPWPNIFKNLRASRSTEVNREFGAFLESQWIGHTQAVAREHYLMVTQEDLDRATVCEPKATQTRAQHTAATGRREPHSWPTDAIKMPVLPGKATLCDPPQNRQVGREGLEVVQETSGNEALAVESNVKCNALADDFSAIDSNLQSLIRAWPSLSESVRKEILKHLPSPSSR